MTTALIIGGSGMLAGLSCQLSEEFDIVGVLSRTRSKMYDLTKIENIVPLYVDYTNYEDLKSVLDSFVTQHGKPSITVSWIHSTAPEATLLVAQYCDGSYFEVTGQSGSGSSHVSHEHEKQILELGLEYHRVILGRKGSRWLRNDEISQGVYEAIKANTSEFFVGEL